MPVIPLRRTDLRLEGQPALRPSASVSAHALCQRMAALQAMAVLGTPQEEGFDAIARLAACVFDTPIALVSFIDGDRLWFKAALGLDVRSADSLHSFCLEAANTRQVLEVRSARLDPRFAHNGFVTGPQAVQYYAGAPIMVRNVAIGAVCVIDYVPRAAAAVALAALEEMARIAAAMLTARAAAFTGVR